ncbi:hypothetical protein HS088_TW03G00350 [Tripterygium wilfordii]|uniref:Uncharacterized protein n=1 Tax=Tripterygium wilfordii TaxID=458696 RepID=A0A7J7DUQ2_TRIWF|nr:hypothetical protein HS088_TW03G00350 [Tripterygium wilfordii]
MYRRKMHSSDDTINVSSLAINNRCKSCGCSSGLDYARWDKVEDEYSDDEDHDDDEEECQPQYRFQVPRENPFKYWYIKLKSLGQRTKDGDGDGEGEEMPSLNS